MATKEVKQAVMRHAMSEGMTESQAKNLVRVTEAIDDVLQAAILTTCAACKILGYRDLANTLVVINIPEFFSAHPVSQIAADPDQWIRDLTLWARDIIQDRILTIAEQEEHPCG